ARIRHYSRRAEVANGLEFWQADATMAHLEPGALLRLIGAYGRLRARLREELSKPPLVLPNGQYFPDHFDGSAAATQRLVLRMQQHAGIADIPIRIVQGQVA